jgi:Rel homology dimerisation domain
MYQKSNIYFTTNLLIIMILNQFPLGDEVMLFVSKLDTKKIQIRFFEEAEQHAWEHYVETADLDIHYQHAISFKTPAYHNENITLNVKVSIIFANKTIFKLICGVFFSFRFSIN